MSEEKMKELERRIAMLEANMDNIFRFLDMQKGWNASQIKINQEIKNILQWGK